MKFELAKLIMPDGFAVKKDIDEIAERVKVCDRHDFDLHSRFLLSAGICRPARHL
jgi:hypothetical protein